MQNLARVRVIKGNDKQQQQQQQQQQRERGKPKTLLARTTRGQEKKETHWKIFETGLAELTTFKARHEYCNPSSTKPGEYRSLGDLTRRYKKARLHNFYGHWIRLGDLNR